MAAPTVYPLSKMYFSPSGDASPVASPSECYEFISESIAARKTTLDTAGSVGTRSHKKERTRDGIIAVGGGFSFYPTPVDMRTWWPRILGAAETGAGSSGNPYVYAVAETLPEFYAVKDLGTKVLSYDGLKVNRATLSAGVGQMLMLDLELHGKTETNGAAGSVSTAPSPDTTTQPWMFFEGVFTVEGTARAVKQFSLYVTNELDLGNYNNSQTRQHLTELDRVVGCSLTVPFSTDEADLYAADYDGAACTLVFTSTVNSNHIMTITLAALQVERETPVASGRGEIVLPINGISRMSSSTKEIAVQIRTS